MLGATLFHPTIQSDLHSAVICDNLKGKVPTRTHLKSAVSSRRFQALIEDSGVESDSDDSEIPSGLRIRTQRSTGSSPGKLAGRWTEFL